VENKTEFTDKFMLSHNIRLMRSDCIYTVEKHFKNFI